MINKRQNTDYPFVSVIMPCRNEINYIHKSLNTILDTAYLKDKIEVIVVDGLSDDGTREVLQEIALQNSILKVLDNPKKITPAALNIGIRQAKGEIVIRVDAHSGYGPDYVNKCVEYLKKTEAWCVGGRFCTVAPENTLIAKVIACVLSSPFGVASYFRTKNKPRYLDTVPFGAFRREVFDRIGLFDERLLRNQDNEFCSRIIRSGGKIYFTPDIKIFFHTPANLNKLLDHARLSGMWNAFTNYLFPYALRWRHFVPLFFFIGLFFCLIFIILGILKNKVIILLGVAPIILYLLLASIYSVLICLKNKFNLLAIFLLIPVFFLYHFNYGYGIFKGLILIFTGGWKKLMPVDAI